MMQERYDRGDIRRLNAMSVLEQLHAAGPLSRAQVASRLGLTRATVSNIISELISLGVVKEGVFEEGGLGRRGLLLELNSSFGSMIAVELDIDRANVILADAGMRCLWRGEAPLGGRPGPESGMRVVSTLVEQALEEAERAKLPCLGIGVAWAGLVDRETGELVYGPISGWEKVTVRQEWSERYGVPVFVENEAHAGAIAEHLLGQPGRVENLIYLSIGIGMSAGVYVDGSLVRGRDGFAGQVGHTPFVAGGHPCGCGRRGCWVTEVGAAGFLRGLRERGVDLPAEECDGLAWIDAVCSLAAAGDAATLQSLDALARQIGEGLAGLVQIYNPSRVVVGGHLRRIVKLCEAGVASAMQGKAFVPMSERLDFSVSDDEDIVLKGCLATVFDAVMLDPLPLSHHGRPANGVKREAG